MGYETTGVEIGKGMLGRLDSASYHSHPVILDRIFFCTA